jgi:hypothetical protein
MVNEHNTQVQETLRVMCGVGVCYVINLSFFQLDPTLTVFKCCVYIYSMFKISMRACHQKIKYCGVAHVHILVFCLSCNNIKTK